MPVRRVREEILRTLMTARDKLVFVFTSTKDTCDTWGAKHLVEQHAKCIEIRISRETKPRWVSEGLNIHVFF
jgi:hypothetical protein